MLHADVISSSTGVDVPQKLRVVRDHVASYTYYM
jgi:hypothetical protein